MIPIDPTFPMTLTALPAIPLDKIKYDDRGLVPAIVQDYLDGTVLMMAWMNRDSLQKTLETGQTWFWSRSRQALWPKGETSGHIQTVKTIRYDCDSDALLVSVEQIGDIACHTGERSCFHQIDGGITAPPFPGVCGDLRSPTTSHPRVLHLPTVGRRR